MLPAIALGAALGLETRILLALGAVVVAAASWRFIEEPFRRGRFAAATPRRVVQFGLATITAVVLLAGGMAVGSVRVIDEIAVAATRPSPSPILVVPTAGPSAATASPPGTGAPPSPSAIASPIPTATPEPTAPPPTWDQIPDLVVPVSVPLPADVKPSLGDARKDTESLFRDGCVAQVPVIKPPDCVYGDPDGKLTVALVGDSHAGQWFPAFEALAVERGWRLVPYVKLSCPFIDMPVEHLTQKREYTECAAWRAEVIKDLAEQQPDIVVVTMSHRGIFPTAPADRSLQSQGEAIGRAMARLPGQRLVMIDTLRTSTDIPACIAANPADVRPCAISRKTGMTDYFGVRERIAAEVSGAGIIDLLYAICAGMPCQVMRDGMIVYRDNHHLTATFAASLAPALEAALQRYVDAIDATAMPGASPGP
jgi:hypothetical protein